MMAAFVRKNLAFFVLNRGRSPVSSSLSLHFCSSATETRPVISPTISDILLHRYDFPPELASRVASRLTLLQHPEKANLVLSFFLETGFSNAQLEKIVRSNPLILRASVEGTFKPKIKFFEEYGFSSDDIRKTVTKCPTILGLSLNNNIVPSLHVLMGLLGSKEEVVRIIVKSPWILTSNLEKTVLPNIEFLKGFGIPINRICSVLCSYPCSFTTAAESVKKAAEKAKGMGLDTRSNSFIYAIPTLVSMGDRAWEAKLQAFRDLGFSEIDILTMFKKAPQVFIGSAEKIKKIVELLLATGKFDFSSIVTSPFSLAVSVEKRYIPRLKILGILESRNLIEEWPVLAKLYKLTDDGFSEEFIMPYLNDVGEVDIIKSYLKARMKSESFR